MKKVIFGTLLLINNLALTMQQPARVYDQEKTLKLKSYLNVWQPKKDFPEEMEIRQLILDGANPNVKADCGHAKDCTWLDSTIFYNDEKKFQDLIALLLFYGADTSDSDLFGRVCQLGTYTTVLLFICFGAKVAGKNARGLTPLGCAIGYSRMDVIKLLLDSGATSDIDIPNNEGETPLSCASKKGTRDIVALLELYKNKKS